MAKEKTRFVCQKCSSVASKWMGKCPDCEAWNSFVEEAAPVRTAARTSLGGRKKKNEPLPSTEIKFQNARRLSSGIGEFDRTLGGGLAPGGLVLVGGDPGIGKSTLLLQSLGRMAQAGKRVLYASGEESPEQIKMRAARLDCLSENLLIYSENCIEDVLGLLDKIAPAALVLDSIQTFYTADLQSAPGSVSQVREVAFKVFQDAKARGLPVFLVGHITKDGSLAGPKTLEHIVDTVIYFEGERTHSYRILRTIKNRFGSTQEIGVFQMSERGLEAVENPSEIFLAERPENSPGSVIVASMEGTRPLLVEVQALVSPSSSIGMPRRMATGLDYNRASLLIAIMEKRLGLGLQQEDVFVNVAGGVKITEPAADLGIATAIAGSFQNKAIDSKTVCVGEIGLTGEVRSVMQLEPRIREAEKLGFNRFILPSAANKGKTPLKSKMELCFVKTLAEALDLVL